MLNFLRARPNSERTTNNPVSDTIQAVANGDVTLIDVRDIAELSQTGKAKDALHIPLMTIGFKGDPRHPEFHTDLDTAKPVAVYCASGARSGMAAQTLRQLGFKSVTNLGGISNWVAAGGALTR